MEMRRNVIMSHGRMHDARGLKGTYRKGTTPSAKVVAAIPDVQNAGGPTAPKAMPGKAGSTAASTPTMDPTKGAEVAPPLHTACNPFLRGNLWVMRAVSNRFDGRTQTPTGRPPRIGESRTVVNPHTIAEAYPARQSDPGARIAPSRCTHATGAVQSNKGLPGT